jgi:hypothetical protein
MQIVQKLLKFIPDHLLLHIIESKKLIIKAVFLF